MSNVKTLKELSPLETAGVTLNTGMAISISVGNTLLNTAATVEDDSLTMRLGSAIKNQGKTSTLIANAPDPAAAKALHDQILATNYR